MAQAPTLALALAACGSMTLLILARAARAVLLANPARRDTPPHPKG